MNKAFFFDMNSRINNLLETIHLLKKSEEKNEKNTYFDSSL